MSTTIHSINKIYKKLNKNLSDVELPYEYLFDDNDVDFIAVEEDIVTILCSDIMKMLQYNTSIFIEENRKTQDTSSLDLFLNADGYKIKHINRDVSGRHILDLDTKFTVKNANLSIEDISKLTLTNTDLQCNYTIEFTSKLSVEYIIVRCWNLFNHHGQVFFVL